MSRILGYSFLTLALKDFFDSSLRLRGISFHSLATILENAFFSNSSQFSFIRIGTPLRIKKVIVEKHELIKRWDEEINLVKKEMANFVAFYMDVTIPQLERMVVELQDKLWREYILTISLCCSYH